jgi:thioredoxin reductase (NADPH)
LDDEAKYIQTDKKQRTSVPGVFAAGDICGPPWQMAKAVGEGCVAGLEAAAYAKKLKIEWVIEPGQPRQKRPDSSKSNG